MFEMSKGYGYYTLSLTFPFRLNVSTSCSGRKIVTVTSQFYQCSRKVRINCMRRLRLNLQICCSRCAIVSGIDDYTCFVLVFIDIYVFTVYALYLVNYLFLLLSYPSWPGLPCKIGLLTSMGLPY